MTVLIIMSATRFSIPHDALQPNALQSSPSAESVGLWLVQWQAGQAAMSMDKLLDAGASIFIRPCTTDGFRFIDAKYLVAIEIGKFRNGLMGDDLNEIFERALKWVAEVKFFEGAQWTPEQIAQMNRPPA